MNTAHGFHADLQKRYPELQTGHLEEPFEEGQLYRKYKRRVLDSDNDFIVVIAASSKSGMSGVGKTTAAVSAARYLDASPQGFNAENKSTLDPGTFAKELLVNQERVPNKSAIIFDEAQGTLSSNGADARRSMAQSVMDITTALSTMRFRQCTAIIVTQSTKWIDKRIDDVLDALFIIQERKPGAPIRAEVFETYYNDLELSPKRYTEHIDSVTWPALDSDDPDYSYLHDLKERSALNELDEAGEADEEETLPKETQIQIAQELRNKGMKGKDIANSPLIEFGAGWVWKHTDAPEDDDQPLGATA